MTRLILGTGAVLAALLFSPPTLHAQAPVMLVCNDGTTQPGSSKVACQDHGGMDWNTTKAWSEMRAGHFAAADSMVCKDGQAAPAGPRACDSHGGVDSVTSLAAVRKRAQAHRYVTAGDSINAAQTGRADSSQGYGPGNMGADTTSRSGAKSHGMDSTRACVCKKSSVRAAKSDSTGSTSQ